MSNESVCSASTRGSTTKGRGIDRFVEDYDISSERKYPSVKDYYVASSQDGKPIQLQSGLTNFSGLQLGDDRIQFTESVMAASFSTGDSERPISPSKLASKIARQHEYDAAMAVVTDADLDHLERVMKNKLFQRSEHVSSPFQIRKAMKFFDKDKSGFISLEDFAHALEFLGFQFTDVQNKALFARYDQDCSGGIDYMEFISKAMFDEQVSHKPEAARDSARSSNPVSPNKPKASKIRPDFDDVELQVMQEEELRRIFNLTTRNNPSNCCSRSEFDLLLMTLLGYEVTAHAAEGCVKELKALGLKSGMDIGARDISIPFDLFLRWWTTTNSPYLEKRSKK